MVYIWTKNKTVVSSCGLFCVYIMRINLFRDLQWLLSNVTNNINQIAKATNTTGVIYKKDIDYMREKIENWQKKYGIYIRYY